MSGGQGRAHRFGHIDSNWPEVLLINDYAVFMGYLSMVVTGTGFLVLTWSTVVLLGGFVALLSNKDFWSLTVITLVQTRIFDVFLNGKISHIGYSLKRLCKAARFIALPHNHKKVGFRGAVRVLVFTIVLCPLFLLYMFGLFVSPWISLWRLIQHDYGVTAGDSSSKAHLQPALVVLYSLALFQGVLFYYRAISAWEEHKLVKNVADKYRFDDLSRGSVMDYLHEIKVGCEKDPSFARGRNLISYAVKMMESTSPDGYLSGARILDTLMRFNRDADTLGGEFPGQSMQIYNMIGSASSSPILHNLVQMLDSKSAYDGEIRLPAARIVEHFAGEIHLDKILQGIRCVSSLLELEQKGFQDDQLSSEEEDDHQLSFEEEDDHHSSVKEKDYHPKDCKQMQLTGMQILLKLSYDKNNLFLMSNTDDPTLIRKIVALVTSKGSLHLKDHNEWSRLAELGVKILSRLVMRSTYGPTKSKDILWHEISTSRKAISTLKSILECDQCDSVLKKHAIRILNRICMDTSSVMVEGDRERFVGFLMDMFLHNSKGDFENLAGEDLALKKEGLSILKEICMDPSSFMGEVDRENVIGYLMDMFLHNSKGDLFEKLAGDNLVQICRSGSNAAIILKKYGHDIVDHIADTRSGVYSSTHRKIAAKILNHLCSPYSTDEEHLQNLKEAIIDLIPKVLREALGWGLTGKEMERMTVSGLEATQDDDRALQKALASLCATVYNRIVSKDADLTGRFNNIAAGICDQAAKPRKSFADLIKETVKVHRPAALAKPKMEPPKPAPCPEPYYYTPPYSMYLGEEDPNACCIS